MRVTTAALAFAAALIPASLVNAQARLTEAEVERQPSSAPTLIDHYGPGALQIGELRLPRGPGPFPVVIVIHGGCFTRGFATTRSTVALASDLAAHGVATWNIEYRQAGDPGGGWPGTFQDLAAAADHLRSLARTQPLDLSRVTAIGHSAGAAAALWLASRGRLADSSPVKGGASPLSIAAVVAIDGPGDLAVWTGRDPGICGGAVEAFMGGAPAEVPDRYDQAGAIHRLPLSAAQTLVSAEGLRFADAARYRAAAAARGERVNLRAFNAGHFDLIAPRTPAGARVEALILEAVAGTRR